MARDPVVGPVDLQYQEKVERQTAPASQFTVGPVSQDAWVVIFAGGQGTRLAEETQGLIPKPMMNVGGKPMLEHIMRIYSTQGLRRFIIATGFMHEVIEEWVDEEAENLATIADDVIAEFTGLDTQTGGRLLRLSVYLQEKPFFVTYGDGFSDINFRMLTDHHMNLKQPGLRKPAVTLSAVHPPARFGNLEIANGRAVAFGEKTQSSIDWINGGFYVMEPAILGLISGDEARLEYDVLPGLAAQNRLGAYQHPGFFQMVDTARDLTLVNQMVEVKQAPWMTWTT